MKRAIATLATSALLLGLLSVPASAETIAPTSLQIRVSDKTPEFKTDVTFTGDLSSSRAKCFQNRQVKLFRNGELIRSKKTNGSGIVKWTITIRANGQWQMRFKGKTLGQHPNEVICEASKSKIIRIDVQNKP